MNPRVTVIIPIYNTEKYLRKCLESVMNQTLRDIEIICVDDGSTDGSGAICDEYAERDCRIRVIHKENGGVSSARNAGLAASSGDWIGWVDSDDWIEPDMFEYLLENALEQEGDIAVCSHWEDYKSHIVFHGWKVPAVLDCETALEQLLENDTMQNYLWDKLWRKRLFAGISFPEGRTFEDIAVMHRLFERANRVICLPDAKYYYQLHSEGIVGNGSLSNRVNYFNAFLSRYHDMRDRWPQFEQKLAGQLPAAAISVWASYYDSPQSEHYINNEQLQEISAFSREHYRETLDEIQLGIVGRCVLRLTRYPHPWAFALSRLFSRVYQIKHGHPL